MILARPARVLALAAAALGLLAACGGAEDEGASGGPERGGLGAGGTVDQPLAGGRGDQRSPALADGLLAFVDFSADTDGGCFTGPEDTDCAGTLVVLRLSDRVTLLRAAAGDALPALGDGFVAWLERPDQRTRWNGRLLAARLPGGEPFVVADNQWQDVDVAPAVSGTRLAYATWGPSGGVVRVDELGPGGGRREWPGRDLRGGVSLSETHVAWLDRDASWRSMLVVVELASGARRELLGDGGAELTTPALGAGVLAYRQGPPMGCSGDDCVTTLVVAPLLGGSRAAHRVPRLSRFGPLLVTDEHVLFLSSGDLAYGLAALPLGGGEPLPLTPPEAVLPWVAPAAVDGDRVAFADRRAGDFDLRVARLP